MVRDLFDKIINGEEVRKNLIELKQVLKEETNKKALLYYAGANLQRFIELLKADDAKIRKNTALIMGELGVQDFLPSLYEAYEKEEQLFVKSSYLSAMSNLEYSSYLTQFQDRLEYLTSADFGEENKKHINEEIRVLTNMLIAVQKPKLHKFIGYKKTSDIVLLTNRNYKEVTLNQIETSQKKEFNAGVIAKTADLKSVLDIRTYLELLFLVKGMNTIDSNPSNIAKTICNSKLMEFLETVHEGTPPFYFRIELKSKMELDKKSNFTKKVATEIEQLSKRTLINTTSNYEFEIRLIENSKGQYNVLLKLYTLKDKRFEYRKNTIATSINPVNAALCMRLAKEYLKEEAMVLDPFCGVGTMLIERNKLFPVKTMYGLDIFGEAIEKARENANLDHSNIYFINRNFFDFKHDYLFDEIVTNMPYQSAKKDEHEVRFVYKKFFEQIPKVLKKDGIIVIHVKDECYVKQEMNNKKYLVEERFELSKKERTYLYVIRYVS